MVFGFEQDSDLVVSLYFKGDYFILTLIVAFVGSIVILSSGDQRQTSHIKSEVGCRMKIFVNI
jgi:hypothetical protein